MSREDMDRMWALTSAKGRLGIIRELEGSGAAWTSDLTLAQLSLIDDASLLPNDLQGALILTFTPEGWSVEKFRRAAAVLGRKDV